MGFGSEGVELDDGESWTVERIPPQSSGRGAGSRLPSPNDPHGLADLPFFLTGWTVCFTNFGMETVSTLVCLDYFARLLTSHFPYTLSLRSQSARLHHCSELFLLSTTISGSFQLTCAQASDDYVQCLRC